MTGRVGLLGIVASLVACGGTGAGAARPPDPSASDGTVAEVVAPSSPAGFRYQLVHDQAFTYQRFDSLITVHPGGKTQIQTFGRTAFFRVTLHDSLVTPPMDSAPRDSLLPDSMAVAGVADSTQALLEAVPSYVAIITLDSIHQDPRSTMRQPALDSVHGASWTILMAPTGGVGTITVDPASTVGQNLSGELARLLYPTVPTAGAAIGATWADSTESLIGGLSVAQTERAMTVFYVPEQDLDATPPVLRVEGRADLVRWGREERGGRTIELEGTGVDSVSYYFGPAGRFVGAEGTDSVAMTFTIPAVGQSVPVYQVGRYQLRETPGGADGS